MYKGPRRTQKTTKHQPGGIECQETGQPRRTEDQATSSPSRARQPCNFEQETSFFRSTALFTNEVFPQGFLINSSQLFKLDLLRYNLDNKSHHLYVYNSASFDNCTQLSRS